MIPVGWITIPLIGTMVKSSHPQTVFNPDEYFEVKELEINSNGAYARGENTCWFNVNMLSPKPYKT